MATVPLSIEVDPFSASASTPPASSALPYTYYAGGPVSVTSLAPAFGDTSRPPELRVRGRGFAPLVAQLPLQP